MFAVNSEITLNKAVYCLDLGFSGLRYWKAEIYILYTAMYENVD